MKQIIINLFILLLASIPIVAIASGLKEYESIRGWWTGDSITKYYDHDENVICYVTHSSATASISCIKDS